MRLETRLERRPGRGTRVKGQWRVWNSVWRAECSLPVEHAIGNHDVWGWNKEGLWKTWQPS